MVGISGTVRLLTLALLVVIISIIRSRLWCSILFFSNQKKISAVQRKILSPFPFQRGLLCLLAVIKMQWFGACIHTRALGWRVCWERVSVGNRVQAVDSCMRLQMHL